MPTHSLALDMRETAFCWRVLSVASGRLLACIQYKFILSVATFFLFWQEKLNVLTVHHGQSEITSKLK